MSPDKIRDRIEVPRRIFDRADYRRAARWWECTSALHPESIAARRLADDMRRGAELVLIHGPAEWPELRKKSR